MKILKLLSALIVLSFLGCDPKDDDIVISNNPIKGDFSKNFGQAVNRDFIGQVVDVDNHPIQNATVTIGGSTKLTDANGLFIINGAAVYEKFAHIIVTKVGYNSGSRSLAPTTGKNNVKIMLLPETAVQTIASGVSTEVTVASGTKIVFDGAFEDENGAAYLGAVSVSISHLMPSDPEIDNIMPGMLYGQGAGGQAKVLENFGMLRAELKGSDGQKLQIATGHTAQIAMAIDPAQMATAPTAIPLWHFDEAGYWIEQGIATKVGNQYVGNVSHFSWWFCGTSWDEVNLTLTVKDHLGNPLSNVGLRVVANDRYSSMLLFTDQNGQLSGPVPMGVPVTVLAYNLCATIIFNDVVGSFASDAIAEVIINDTGDTESNVVSGTLVNCNGQNVANGYIEMQYGIQKRYVAVTDGTFSVHMLSCASVGNNFFVRAVDFEASQTSNPLNFHFTPGSTSIGIVQVCNQQQEFIAYQTDNNPTNFIYSNISAGATQQHLFSVDAWTQNFEDRGIRIFGSSTALGTYTLADGFTMGFKENLSGNGYHLENNASMLVVNINKYGAVGEFIDLTFYGSYPPYFQNVTGTAHVKRDF